MRLLCVVVFVSCCTLAACGDTSDGPAGQTAQRADLGANPSVQETDVAPARYTPPPGTWRVRSASLRPGEWYEEYASEDGVALMRVNVFPIRGSRAPGAVIGLAIDVFLRSLGVEGFGTGGQRTMAVWGAAAAQTSWTAVVGGKTVAGGARLVRVSDEHWAFAIGYVARDASKERHPPVRAFVESLEPSAPVFYARRFFNPDDLALVVARPRGEPPVTMRDLLAVELVLEAGAGMRFPLSTRPAVRAALREDVHEKDPSTRTAYRETGAAYEKSAQLAPAERLQGMRALGGRALQGLLSRAGKGYEPAMRFAAVWKRLRAPAAGMQAENGLTVGAVQSLHEMSAFFASLAANREVKTTVERSDRIAKALAERWPQLAASEKERLREAGAAWALLRRRWDASSPEQRLALRRSAAHTLAPQARQATLPDAGDAHALMAWMDAIEDEALDALVLHAARMDSDGRRTLFDALGAPEATAWELGW